MNSRIIIAILSVLICPKVHAQKTTPTTPANPPSTSEKPVEILKVHYLKYLSASSALRLLQNVGPDIMYAEDSRINSIIARGTDSDHDAIKSLLEEVDTQERNHVVTKIMEAKSRELQASEKIVKQIAEKSGVTLALDEKLGVILLKGPAQEVEWASEVINEISAVSNNNDSRKTQSNLAPQTCALRLIWLSDAPSDDLEAQIAPEPAIAASIEKLARLGFPNMKPKMQLVCRCDLIDGRAHCQVDGTKTNGKIARTINFKAHVRRSGEASVIGEIQIEANADVRGDLNTNDAPASKNAKQSPSALSNQIEVVVHLQPQKSYILSASPIGGFQSAFLVQLVDGFE